MGLDIFKSLISGGISSIADSASNIIKDYKTDPTKLMEAEKAIEQLQIQAKTQSEDVQSKIEMAYLSDMNSAREMNVRIATSNVTPKLDKIAPYLLAFFITVGFFGLLGFLMMYEVPKENKDILNVMLGSLGTAWLGVVHFFYSSSVGSKDKDATIEKLANG